MTDKHVIAYEDDRSTWPQWVKDYEKLEGIELDLYRLQYPRYAKWADQLIEGSKSSITETPCDENLERHKRAVRAFFAYINRLSPEEYRQAAKWMESVELEESDKCKQRP